MLVTYPHTAEKQFAEKTAICYNSNIMLIFQRSIESKILERLFKNRAILIFGPRQAGKTTLAKTLLTSFGKDGAYFNCELAEVRDHFIIGKPEALKALIRDARVAVFDEAQTIQDIGVIIKAFIDTYPQQQIIATGSSSFDLANKINEPLTGRAFEFTLYPLSVFEIQQTLPDFSIAHLHELMRLGSYPAVVAEANTPIKEDILKNLATNYLYKDVYTYESIRNPRVFESLIKILALQIGSLVSVNELAQSLGISRMTVDKYLRLLEQSYIIKVVRPFSRNHRNEIKKAFKVYFLDVGVRNAIVGDVSLMSTRTDRGFVFENFFASERIKTLSLEPFSSKLMFWRTRSGEEIDFVEESEGRVRAYECKWGNAEPVRFSAFLRLYPKAEVTSISPEKMLS